jgi:PAS domain S-box-containing protein
MVGFDLSARFDIKGMQLIREISAGRLHTSSDRADKPGAVVDSCTLSTFYESSGMPNAERPQAPFAEEGQHRLLLDAITDYAIYMLDPAGIITSWNSGAQRFSGYTPAEIVGRHFSLFHTEEDQQAGLPQRSLDIAINAGKYEAENLRVRKDGSVYWAHVVIDPILDPTGKLVGFATITRDLTEKKAAEEALRQSEQQFRLLVQGVTDYAIFMLDRDGCVSSWNSGAKRIKGYTSDEIIGAHFSHFYTPEDRERGDPERSLEVAIREGRCEKEGWRVRKDGSRFWAHVVLDAIHDDDGELIGFAKITRDVTERMETQKALEEAREALFQSQKMEAIGRLTGGIAHDFNNLLAAILGSLELVDKRLPADAKVRPLIENAIQGAQRGASLTRRLLAFARRQELNPEPVDAAALVRGMSAFLQRTLGPSITIEIDFPHDLPPVLADSNQLESALLNLAVNSRDAMPDGGVITIAARQEMIVPGHSSKLEPGHYVCLSVSDTGEGMDEQTLARAMEPFFTTKGVGKGTGLGLSMVHGLAEQSNGRLILKSRKGEGTMALLWLPVAELDAATLSFLNQASTPSAAPGTRELSILTVDDDFLVLTNTVAMLEDLGHRVFEASSGEQALQVLEREAAIDLVITDQAMPQMTGTQLADVIKLKWPHLPVILATGHTELEPGLNPKLQRLTKPFRQVDLVRVIAEAVRAEPALSQNG